MNWFPIMTSISHAGEYNFLQNSFQLNRYQNESVETYISYQYCIYNLTIIDLHSDV